jgi:hypothetical protein
MRTTLRGNRADTFVFDEEAFRDWAVFYEHDKGEDVYKIVKVESWVTYHHRGSDPDYRWKRALRIGNAQDELDAYTQAMRILKDLPE